MKNARYAGFWRRCAAFAIDGGLMFLITGVWHLFSTAMALLPSAFAAQGGVMLEVDFFSELLAAAVTVVAWTKFFGTPGKLLCDCYVVDADSGRRISLRQAVIRYAGYFIALLPMGLGFLWILWDKQKRGWHDLLARTSVITEPARPFDDESQKTLQQLIGEVR